MNYAANSPQRRSSARRQHARGGLETKVDVLRDPEAERAALAEVLLLQLVLKHLAAASLLHAVKQGVLEKQNIKMQNRNRYIKVLFQRLKNKY